MSVLKTEIGQTTVQTPKRKVHTIYGVHLAWPYPAKNEASYC